MYTVNNVINVLLHTAIRQEKFITKKLLCEWKILLEDYYLYRSLGYYPFKLTFHSLAFFPNVCYLNGGVLQCQPDKAVHKNKETKKSKKGTQS